MQLMEVRTEQPEDIEAIRNVNISAFGREHEADLVDRLHCVRSNRLLKGNRYHGCISIDM
jgi:predicted N-acetyltransferase YhbS